MEHFTKSRLVDGERERERWWWGLAIGSRIEVDLLEEEGQKKKKKIRLPAHCRPFLNPNSAESSRLGVEGGTQGKGDAGELSELSASPGGEMEDTPTRSKSGGTPLSKIEDSPVFNFMNNLSPIQPVKATNSVHIAHTHQSLNLASLSSIFSSPHANPPRETRILSRPSLADFSKHESFSSYATETGTCSEASDVVRQSSFSSTAQENCTVTCLLNEAIIDSPDQCPTLPSTSSQPVQYVSGSPDHITTPSYVVKSNIKLHIGHTPADFVPFVQNGVDRQKNLFAMEADAQEDLPFQLNDAKVVGCEMIGCDWENLITDEAEDLLIFDTSLEPEVRDEEGDKAAENDGNVFVSLLPNCTENEDSLRRTQPDDTHGRCVQNTNQDRPMNHIGGSMKKRDSEHGTKMLPGTSQSQVENHLQRGMRRRCLVFDVAGVSIANMRSESNLKPSTSLSSKCKSIRDANNWRASVSPSLCALPGIGLHLNTLTSTSKDRMVGKETGASGKQQISIHCSVDPFPSTTAEGNSCKLPIEKDLSPTSEVEELQIVPNDAEKDEALVNCEELSQDSPKRKRRKSENGGDSDGCNRCNCKKSKCLKLYCVCFAAGVYCSEPCSCQGCFNKPIHEETVLSTRKQIESRNPLAFAPKVIQPSEAGPEMGDDNNKTPASARHKRGCNCKKSNCLKKYCECYQGGVGCSISCRCEGCKNAFGRKDGTLPGVEEIEQAEEEIGACDKENESVDDDQQNANMQNEEHFSGKILPLTPYQSCRLSIDLPLFSSAKPPRITKLSIVPSPGLYGSRMLQKSDILPPEHKSVNNTKTGFEDDTPDILKPSASPTKGIKIASPNCKRVSPPHNAVGLSPNRKGCRKLILKSIPSFPSLNNDVISSEYPAKYPTSSFSSSS